MKKETLQKGNKLASEIKMIEDAIDSFVWNDGLNTSKNISIIIECDDSDGGRERNQIPGFLEKEMKNVLLYYLQKLLVSKKEEFESL